MNKLFLSIGFVIVLSTIGAGLYNGYSGNQGCASTLHLNQVDSIHLYVVEDRVISVNDTILENFPLIKASLDEFMTSDISSLFIKDLSIQEQNDILDEFTDLSPGVTGENTEEYWRIFDYALLYQGLHISFGIVNC